MKRPTPIAIVGLVSLIGLVILLGFTFMIKKTLLGPRRELNVLYERISGLEVGSPVYVAGVYAGEVVRIGYRPSNKNQPVVVSLAIQRKFDIYQNARVDIVNAGIIGDKRVEINPGSPDVPTVPDGEYINGNPQFDMDRTMREGQQIVSDLAASVASLREVMTDEENLKALRNSMRETEKTLVSVNNLVMQADAVLGENREDMRSIIIDLRDVASGAKGIAAQAESLLAASQAQVTAVGERLQSTAASLDTAIADTSGEIAKTTRIVGETAEEVRGLTVDTRGQMPALLRNLESASGNLNDILMRIREGRGTVGKLINDPGPFDELNRMITALRRALLGRAGYEIPSLYEEPVPPTPTPGPKGTGE